MVGSKADVATSELHDPDAITLSAVTRTGLDAFLGRLGNLVDEARAMEFSSTYRAVRDWAKSGEEGFTRGSAMIDGGRAGRASAERVVAMADLTNEEAIEYVQVRLRRMGVERALARAGAREGDVVRVGPVELEYQEGIA